MAETRTRRESHKGYPKRGEIYLTALDPALGHEIKKTRPTLIIQNDISNQYGSTTIVAAITSKVSTPPYPNEAIIHPGGSGLHLTFHGPLGSTPHSRSPALVETPGRR